jgi:hypothetical protein
MTDHAQPEAFWEQAADTFEQIVADGGDPKTDPTFSGDARVLATVRLIVEARKQGQSNDEDGDVGSHTDDDAIIRQKLIDAEIPGAVIEFDPAEADRAGAFVEDALSEEDARAAEDGLEPPAPAPAPTKGALFALARAKI